MEILLGAERIQERVAALARNVEEDYAGEALTIVGVLNGSLMFLADLVRHMRLRQRIGFVQASSYRGEVTAPGKLVVVPDLTPEIRGRHVLLLDDILDTGQTLAHLLTHFQRLEPRSLKVAVLLRKIGRQKLALEPDYCGFEIPDAFVVGYGMDYDDEYRHLPYIGVLPTPGFESRG
jgi:hypoxanthine phosphoribosyltransferase